ncbi:MAG: DUF3426 domain-containing protein, partial [Syntrophobacteraceae bacterium]
SEKLDKPRNKVRCSKCKNIFTVEQPDEDGLIHIEISDEESAFIPGTVPEQIGGAAGPEVKKKWSLGKTVLFAGVAVVLMFAMLALFLWPGSPLLVSTGKRTLKEPTQPVVTIMDSVQAYYLENVHSGQVLVIEGEVLNESSRPISFVMIEGKLYNNNDTVAQIQRCYVGNSLTRKEIANLKLSEIQEKIMYREGKNLKDVRIPPAGKVSFMVVFHNLPEMSTLSNYSVNVISSKFD